LLRDPDLFVQGRRFYPEFLTEAMLRGTTLERFEAYKTAVDPITGWMTRAEVRELENLPPEDKPNELVDAVPPADPPVVEDPPALPTEPSLNGGAG
jgi:phage portal protein BeeE